MGSIGADTFLIVGMVIALGAGALSFLSPCVLPIFPAYMSYITGISVRELQESKKGEVRKSLLSHSAFFLLGVSLVFISLGIGASFLGKWIQSVLTGNSGLLIQRIAGIFIIIMGRSEEHTSELQSRGHLVCRLLLEKKKGVAQERIVKKEVGRP